ncbi:MAG: lipoyl synthase, partial [Candidatus Bipolaricaulota bacterium]
MAGRDVALNERPSWLRVRLSGGGAQRARREVRAALTRHGLHTVCEEARCPNLGECWAARTATFMLLGDRCTRSCRFCGVASGDPGGRIDREEPERIASAARDLGLAHVVLTSVDRDDLPDGGAAAFRSAVEAVHRTLPEATIEALVPDLSEDREALRRLSTAPLDVLGHNLETVRRLSPAVRDRRAGYDRSLRVLAALRSSAPTRVLLKSSLMLGLGECEDEIEDALRDLYDVGVQVVTLGQYLRPTERALPVARYVLPETFRALEGTAYRIGFHAVVAGPLVRSSYHAR